MTRETAIWLTTVGLFLLLSGFAGEWLSKRKQRAFEAKMLRLLRQLPVGQSIEINPENFQLAARAVGDGVFVFDSDRTGIQLPGSEGYRG